MTNALSVVEIFRCVTATTKKREYTRMNEKTKIFVEKEECRRLWDLLCEENPPANIWQLVVGLASLVELCLRRESVGHEAEKGVVKGSVER